VRQSILGCFQTLTAVAGAADDFDLLVEMRNLHLIHILLDMLMVDTHRGNPNMMGSIITILTNMSLNDQNNVKIRLHGAHIIGGLLMENCTTFNVENSKKYVNIV
jgi:hypothetical protein